MMLNVSLKTDQSTVSRCCSLAVILLAGLALHAMAADEPPSFVLPPGFTIERVDAGVETRFPMFGALDDQGHLYVTESSGGDLYQELREQIRTCRISRLRDINGDGRYDESVVFAEGLTPSMGLVWREGKLYVADPPDLAVYEDRDGDGRADRRSVLLTGFGHRDNGSLHGLTFGPDGWLYFTMGNPDGCDLTGPDGSHVESRTGALIRCRADGTGVEMVSVGFENLVEVEWLPDGSIIGTLNWYHVPHFGIRDALVQLLEGGR